MVSYATRTSIGIEFRFHPSGEGTLLAATIAHVRVRNAGFQSQLPTLKWTPLSTAILPA